MKRIPLVLFVLFALSCNPDRTIGPGNTSSTKAPATPPKTSKLSIAVSGTNRYLVDQQGNPILLSGDAAWSLIAQLSTPDAEYYLQQRSAYGFNFSLVNLIEHQYATNAPANFYKDKPFTGRPFATPNEAYFAHADQVIALAANYGIFIALDATYIGYNFDSEGWGNEMKQATDAEMLSWGQYCGTRYKDYPNIIWVIGGDWDPTQVKSKLQNFINGLKATDPNHIITAHNQPESQSITPWPGQLTLNGFYTYSNTLYDQATSTYNYAPTMPFIQLESKYENEHSSTAVQLRSQVYWTILCGGTGDIFGNYPTWRFSYGGGNWKPQMSSVGSTSMKYMAALFRSRNWHKIIPDFTHQVMTSGYGTGANYATTAKTSDGSSIISYLPNKKTVTVNTSSLAGDSTDCWWYSPTAGTSTYIGRFAKGSRSFTSPSTTDWVFVADAVSFGFGTPGVGTPQPPVPAPSGTFSALPDTLPFKGGTTVLSWTSQYATSLSIDHGIGPVDSVGSLQAHVDSTTMFTLSLTGGGGIKQYQAKVVVLPPQPPSGSFAAIPDTLLAGGGTTTLSWTAVNDTSVVIDHGVGKVDSAGTLGVRLDSTTTFTMTIKGFGGSKQYQKTIVVLPPPPPSGAFTAIPDTLSVGGGLTLLFWSSSNATSATIDHGIGAVDTVGSTEATVSVTTTFLLTLTGKGGTTQLSRTVFVPLPPPPTGTFIAIPDTLPIGGGMTLLTWSTTNDTSNLIDHGIGRVDTTGSMQVNVTETTTYLMTLQGKGGTRQLSLTVFVPLPPPPTGTLTANPDTLAVGGGSTVLSWSSSYATSASIDHGIGAVNPSGSMTVSISATTTFLLTLTGVSGTEQISHTVLVPLPPPPTGTFTASPDTLPVGGGTTTLSWSSSDASTATLDHGIGAVTPSGSLPVSVSATTTYLLTLTGAGGTKQISHTVFVPIPPPPTGTFTASPDTLPVGGGSTTLSWLSSNATTASIDHGIGTVALSGSTTVSVSATTTFLLTLTGVSGTKQISHTVFVPLPPPPTGTFTASPDTLPVGGGISTLSWLSTDATTATIDHGIGAVAPSGSLPVSVSATTTYLLTLAGAGGTKQISHTVFVSIPPPPTGTFRATPSSLPAGGGLVTLAWTSQNASSVSINPGIGAVNLNDSLRVNVTATTTYTLHVQNITGTADYPITVTVALPQPSAEVLYDDAYRNSWSTIRSWSVTLTPGNTTPVERGTASLKSVMSAWGSLQLSTGTWSAFGSHDNTRYSALDFWVNAGTKAFVLYVSAMSDSPSYSTNLKSYVTISLPANTWTHVTIPMSSLATTPFVALNFSSYSVAATFYLDDMQLVLNP